MSNIYIGGDSFCACRDDLNHWPFILASMMNCTLQGQGFPGMCWWETRKNLITYINSNQFENTEYFIFVHTDFNRMLNDNKIQNADNKDLYNFYVKYLHSNNINTWIMHQWFKEINLLLSTKKVVNLYGFDECFNSAINPPGLKLGPSLLELSLAENNRRLAENIFQAIQNNHLEHKITL